MDWDSFEQYCVDYLNERFGEFFSRQGGADSTCSDIVFDNQRINFAIECKKPHAQSGQFVLFPNKETKTFEFSSKNKTAKNITGTDEIINFLNSNFDEFCNPGTSGVDVDLDNKIFENWIISMYRKKGVKYVVTSSDRDTYDNIIVFPLEHIGKYFDISCKYRIKKSGSSALNRTSYEDLCSMLEREGINFSQSSNFQILTEERLNTEIYTSPLRSYKFNLNEAEPRFTYKIRSLSNTRNANIIFSLALKTGVQQDPNVIDELEQYINEK